MRIHGKNVWLSVAIVAALVLGIALYLWRDRDESGSSHIRMPVPTSITHGAAPSQSINARQQAQDASVYSPDTEKQKGPISTKIETTEAFLVELRKAIEDKTAELPTIINKLKAVWKGHPPVDLLLTEITREDVPNAYRQILIDALVSYRRTLSDDERAKVFRGLEALFLNAKDEASVRIVAMQRYSSLHVLMEERGVSLGPEAGDALYNCLQTAEEGSPLHRQALASLATIQDKRIVPNLQDDLRQAENLEPERLRAVVGAAGILKEQGLKDQLIKVLDTTTDARVYRATAYSLGLMADYSVIEALNRNYDKLDAGPLIKHIFKSNKDVIRKGIEGDDIPAARACIAATARTADSDCLDALVDKYPEWGEETRLYTVETLGTSRRTPALYIEKMRQRETSDDIISRIDTLFGEQ